MGQEDKESFCNSVRSEVKMAGLMDTTGNCWDHFLNKVSSWHTAHCARLDLQGFYTALKSC